MNRLLKKQGAGLDTTIKYRDSMLKNGAVAK
jgi:hypothetical protein